MNLEQKKQFLESCYVQNKMLNKIFEDLSNNIDNLSREIIYLEDDDENIPHIQAKLHEISNEALYLKNSIVTLNKVCCKHTYDVWNLELNETTDKDKKIFIRNRQYQLNDLFLTN